MKLTRDYAKTQAARLFANALLVPQTDEGLREVVDCLVRNCQGPEHCAATMTALLDRSIELPRDVETTTARLAYCARQLQTPEAPPAGCARCEIGEDVTTGEMRWSGHVTGERNGYSFAVRCDCDRGRWLLRKDAERKAAEGRLTEKKPPSRHEHPADADWAKRAAGDCQ